MADDITIFSEGNNGWIGDPIFNNLTCAGGKLCNRLGKCFPVNKPCGISPILRKKFNLSNWAHKTPISFYMKGNATNSTAIISIIAKGNNSDPVVISGPTRLAAGIIVINLDVSSALSILDSEVEIIMEQTESSANNSVGVVTIEEIIVTIPKLEEAQVLWPELKVKNSVIAEEIGENLFNRIYFGLIDLDGSKMTQDFIGDLIITISDRSFPDDPLRKVQQTIPIFQTPGQVLTLEPEIPSQKLSSINDPVVTIELIEQSQIEVQRFEAIPAFVDFVDIPDNQVGGLPIPISTKTAVVVGVAAVGIISVAAVLLKMRKR